MLGRGIVWRRMSRRWDWGSIGIERGGAWTEVVDSVVIVDIATALFENFVMMMKRKGCCISTHRSTKFCNPSRGGRIIIHTTLSPFSSSVVALAALVHATVLLLLLLLVVVWCWRRRRRCRSGSLIMSVIAEELTDHVHFWISDVKTWDGGGCAAYIIIIITTDDAYYGSSLEKYRFILFLLQLALPRARDGWKGIFIMERIRFFPLLFSAFVLSVVSLWSLGLNSSSVQPLDILPAICLVFPRLATVAPLFLRTPCFPPLSSPKIISSATTRTRTTRLPTRERNGTTMFRNRGAEDII